MFSQRLKTIAFVATIAACFLTPAAAEEKKQKIEFSTGGTFRYPNTVQEKDSKNVFASGWIKGDIKLGKSEKSEYGLIAIGSAALDSEGFNWNNNTRLGFGAYYKLRPMKGLSVTFNLRQEYYREFSSSKKESAAYASLSYYYFKSFDPKSEAPFLGLTRKGAELKSYGSIKYPGSLQKNDKNVTFNMGIEYAAKLAIPDTKLSIMPYASLNLAGDIEKKGYNNKIRPALGLRLKYKLDGGSIYAGLNAEADHRPIEGTTNSKLQLTAGWYKKF